MDSAPVVPYDLAQSSRIAVLIPCYNEELTVARVVADFRAALPAAAIYVFDNNSSDATTEAALRAGAQVRQVPLKGKGNVVRRMFADIEADAYVLVDGDDTYDAAAAPAMIAQLFDEHLDTVVGVREPIRADAHRPGHAIGNAMLSALPRPSVRQPLRRYPLRLPGILASLRQVISGAVERLRNRNRADGPCARTETAQRRSGHRSSRKGRRARPASSRPSATAFASSA